MISLSEWSIEDLSNFIVVDHTKVLDEANRIKVEIKKLLKTTNMNF
jgi:hypothetical protein